MDIRKLADTANALVAPGKGILAADESTTTIKRRFDSIGAESTEETRRDYRELLFRTPGAAEFVSGVILYDETIRQNAADGTSLVKVLQDQGVIPGIKVDTGAKPLTGAPGETVTEGLDGLAGRLAEYAELGARFTKWRATIYIGADIPAPTASRSTRTPWPATPPSARRRAWSPWWSRRCSWTATTTSTGAWRSRRPRFGRSSTAWATSASPWRGCC